MKMVRIFFYRIRDQIRLEGFKFVRIRVWMFNIRYRIRIRIFKLYIYNVDIQSYLSDQKYENKYDSSDIRSYLIHFHPYL